MATLHRVSQVLDEKGMIERILVPTDGSPESDRALPVAERVAGAQDAEVLLVQVVPYPVLMDNYSAPSTTLPIARPRRPT